MAHIRIESAQQAEKDTTTIKGDIDGTGEELLVLFTKLFETAPPLRELAKQAILLSTISNALKEKNGN